LGKSGKTLLKKYSIIAIQYLHCKKRLAAFPSPAGMSLTKLFLGGNNFIIPAHIEIGK
jgi:hypothetical protein